MKITNIITLLFVLLSSTNTLISYWHSWDLTRGKSEINALETSIDSKSAERGSGDVLSRAEIDGNINAKPTRTPRPTPTPPFIPPASDPEYIGLMILLGIFSIGVLLIGIWINRKRI